MRSSAFPSRVEACPWFEAGRTLDGDEALGLLRERSADHPYCVYVHVPFCASICSFCALYTRAVPSATGAPVFNEYVERIRAAALAHPRAGRGGAPTTVHFGGGTPLHIGMERLGAVTAALREAFGDSPTCEWAVETTTSSIDPATVAGLRELRFDRVHLGIQTLDEDIRGTLRRHESGETALEKIRVLRAAGFHVSIDLILGFEGATGSVVLDDLRQLHDAGTRMFSLCELRHRVGGKFSAEQQQAAADRNRELWRVVWDFMGERGLRPIHLGQFGESQADNLYFTHPARGEDCVAIGPYAHGSAGRLYYQNRLLPDYYEAVASPIASAVLYDDAVQTIRDLERDLLAHRVSRATVEAVSAAWHDGFPAIFERWIAHGLLTPSDGGYTPTVDGSWFVGNMIFETRGLVRREVAV